jgi:hypothetical protein
VRPPRRGRSSRRLREEATIPSFKHKKKTRHHTVYIEGEFSSDMWMETCVAMVSISELLFQESW